MVNVNAPPLTGIEFEHAVTKWAQLSYFVTIVAEPHPLCVFNLFQRVLECLC
jgi:hypothetical protein